MQLQINNMSLMKDHDNKMDDDVSKFSTSNQGIIDRVKVDVSI